jgi:hypothetical protein
MEMCSVNPPLLSMIVCGICCQNISLNPEVDGCYAVPRPVPSRHTSRSRRSTQTKR